VPFLIQLNPGAPGWVDVVDRATRQLGLLENFLYNNDSTTPLGISATFTGTGRNMATVAALAKFRAAAISDQSGTLKIQGSPDGITWRTLATAATAAVDGNQVALLSIDAYAVRLRVIYVNGAIAQTFFQLTSQAGS
jgi:hypothetical protein